jgi:hypothetical protein
VNDWQPIETAPKDGSAIVIYCPRRGVCAPAHWDDCKYATKPRPYWRHFGEYLWGVAETRRDQPTHWMPIPAHPEAVKP